MVGIDIESGQDHIKMVLSYTLKKIPEKDKIELENLLISTLSRKKGAKVMPSIADSYIKEGIQIGEARGIEFKALEIAAKMLSKGVDVATISEFTGLEIAAIARLKKSAKK